MHIALAGEDLQCVFVKYVYKLVYFVFVLFFSIYLMIVHTDLLVYWKTNKSNVHSYLSFEVIIKREKDLFLVTHRLRCFSFWHRIWSRLRIPLKLLTIPPNAVLKMSLSPDLIESSLPSTSLSFLKYATRRGVIILQGENDNDNIIF